MVLRSTKGRMNFVMRVWNELFYYQRSYFPVLTALYIFFLTAASKKTWCSFLHTAAYCQQRVLSYFWLSMIFCFKFGSWQGYKQGDNWSQDINTWFTLQSSGRCWVDRNLARPPPHLPHMPLSHTLKPALFSRPVPPFQFSRGPEYKHCLRSPCILGNRIHAVFPFPTMKQN